MHTGCLMGHEFITVNPNEGLGRHAYSINLDTLDVVRNTFGQTIKQVVDGNISRGIRYDDEGEIVKGVVVRNQNAEILVAWIPFGNVDHTELGNHVQQYGEIIGRIGVGGQTIHLYSVTAELAPTLLTVTQTILPQKYACSYELMYGNEHINNRLNPMRGRVIGV